MEIINEDVQRERTSYTESQNLTQPRVSNTFESPRKMIMEDDMQLKLLSDNLSNDLINFDTSPNHPKEEDEEMEIA